MAKSPHLPPVEHRFKPGQSGNPGGNAKGVRNRLTAKFLSALADDFDEHGKEALEACRIEDPTGYVKALVALMPKQVEQTNALEDLNDNELAAAIQYLRERLAQNAGAGSGEAEKLPTVVGVQTVQ